MKINLESHSVQYTIIGIILIICLGITTFITGKALFRQFTEPNQDFTTADGGRCNIAVIPIAGELWSSYANADAQNSTDGSSNTSADYVLQEIEHAKNDKEIKGVILRIDSPGGSSVAGNLIANALKRLDKPSAAVIWDQGDSAAYLAATGANTIIASPNSDIGDIGVTGSYIDQTAKDQQNGEKFISITAGMYKDLGSPDNPLTPSGRALLQKQVDEMYQNFVQEVAQNRGMSVDAVKALANGESFVASTATSTGLIDSLGDSETARIWFKQKLGWWSDPVLCE